MRRPRRLRAVAGGLALVVALVACTDDTPPKGSAPTFDPFATTGSGSEASDSGPTTSPALLAVGDCFDADNFAPGAPIDRNGLRMVSCDEAHQHEVYAIARDPDPPGAPFPGDEAMAMLAQDRCLSAFEPAIGEDYVQSSLDFASIVPDAASWRLDDRSVICAVHSIDFAPLTRSVRRSLSSESG